MTVDLELAGKRAFVSGSTRGIGRAIATALLEEGAAVVINGRDEDGVAAAVDDLRIAVPGGDATGIAADFAHPYQVHRLLDGLGEVDILVNNVGLFEIQDFTAIADDEWQRYFDVNVMSGVRLSRALLGPMLTKGWGRIIFIASESGVDVPADMTHYGTTKAGMLALGNGLAKLTRGTEVTVNTVIGGPTYSDGVAQAVDRTAAAQAMSSKDLRDAIVGGMPTSLVQRFLEPAEIANLVLYLASPRSSATNGAAIRADGGLLTTIL